jgi:uncharacterized protein
MLKISKLMGQLSLIYAFALGQSCSAIAQPILFSQVPRPKIINQPISLGKPPAPNPSLAQFLPITATAKIANQVVELEVTRTAEQQSRGLMFRDRLPDNRGMLFPFDPPYSVSFWMKNCAVPLDMVFIYQNKVVAIANSAPPCVQDLCPTYPKAPVLVDQVIELRENWAKDKGLKVGDRVEVQIKQK